MLKKLLGKIFRFNQQTQAKIEWQQIDEPILLSWTTRGVVGNTTDLLLRKVAFIAVIFFLGVLPIILALVASKTWLGVIIMICGMGVVAGPIIFMMYFFTIAGKLYTYRITKKTLELVGWNDGMPKAKEIILLFLWIISPFIFIVFITEPSALLVGLGGMAGVGILAGVTFFSKGYIESHLEYQHFFTHLNTIEQLQIDQPRKYILFIATNYNLKKPKKSVFNVFCTEENFNTLVKLITEQAAINNIKAIYAEAYTLTN